MAACKTKPEVLSRCPHGPWAFRTHADVSICLWQLAESDQSILGQVNEQQFLNTTFVAWWKHTFISMRAHLGNAAGGFKTLRHPKP